LKNNGKKGAKAERNQVNPQPYGVKYLAEKLGVSSRAISSKYYVNQMQKSL
jgi:hypothetical protein